MQLASLLGHTHEILGIILHSPHPADSLIDQFFRARKYLGSHDRRFIAETAYGTLRHLRRCDWTVTQACKVPSSELFPEDLLFLQIAAFHILERRQPALTAETLLPRIKGSRLKDSLADVFARFENLTLPSSGDDAASIGITFSFPDWMVNRIVSEYGLDEAKAIFARLNQPAPLTVRVNTLQIEREKCQEVLRTQGIETVPTLLSPIGLQVPKRMNMFSIAAFKEGMFEVQDEGSQLLPLLIDPKPTAKVLDACAGAGGKTLEFAAIMKNRGEILAADINGFRLEELKKRSRRAGASNIRIREIDDLRELEDQFLASFDVVFVDAPCSGIGTIRRNPGMKWLVTEETVREVSVKQRAILESCASLVKPGGRLVYATCTLFREENEETVESFLSSHEEFRPFSLEAAVARLNIKNAMAGPWLKLMPHIHETDGFFCAVLEKQLVR
jgi:16S rRNA (cytosine967-C5)-methyltransferase